MLQVTYSGFLGRGPREPKRAAMLVHAYGLLENEDMAGARDYSRRLGLGESEIDAAREEMRRWLVANEMIARCARTSFAAAFALEPRAATPPPSPRSRARGARI